MDPKDVAAEMRQGVSHVCATCRKYWQGRASGLPRPQCTTLVLCGSPIAGDVFSQYDGPITDFTRWCFVCSRTADFAVQVRNEDRQIGICKEHVEFLVGLEASELEGRTHVLSLATGVGRLPLLQLLPKPKKNLFQAIAEFDAGVQEEEDRKQGR